MSVALAEALKNVDLEAGRTYRCQVNGYHVEMRVTSAEGDDEESMIPESDIRMDPWMEFPLPFPKWQTVAEFVAPLLPDVPEIPAEDD